MLREELQELRNAKFESDTTSQEEEEDKKTIDELKEKVMILVEEKLHLQSMVDSLEHQFVEVDLEENNKDMINKINLFNFGSPAFIVSISTIK